jgi:cytochrome P450
MAFDLEVIDTILKGDAFGVSLNDLRAQRVQQLGLPKLDLWINTLPFYLSGSEHEKAHHLYYTVIQAAFSKTALRLIDGCLIQEVQRFKQACLAQTVEDHGVLEGPEVDLSRLFNLWMTRVILKLVGIPTRSASDVIRSIRQIVVAGDTSAPDELYLEAESAVKNLFALCDPYLETEEMKRGVCASMLSSYARGEMDRERLLAAIGGFLTTAAENPPGSVIALVKGLTRYPEQLQMLREKPTLINKAADEAFRWFTNSGYIVREVLTASPLSQTQLFPGDMVACIPEAVHDNPTLHPHPEAFMIERKQRHVRAFGGGAWACTGQRLVRELVARTAKHLLLDESPVFTLTSDEEYGSNSFFRAPLHLYAKCVFPAE